MASLRKEFELLEIQLEDIKSATNNFNEENVIGHGGFGKVYKGELSHCHSSGKRMVALKRLDRKNGQGDTEFYKEVRMLSCYRHENIISLLGFSSGQEEMILIYEYASRGSLDGYLKDVTLTWTQRIKVCLDAAKGLCYLHDPKETYQRLIHCDIKSANILLDENFKAIVSDFGLSKVGPANQQNSVLVTSAMGTFGYCDPLFMETYSLTKESDVYSFGVVLFEVLCGKLCFEFSNGQLKVLVPMWKQSYEQKQLSDIVFQGLTEQMNPASLETFADIAYKCLKRVPEERPAMSLVVEKLQESLALQGRHDLKLPKEYEEIFKAAVPPLNYRSLDELQVLLTEGFHVNKGKTFSVNEKGQHIERIYIQACLDVTEIEDGSLEHPDIVNSRFPRGLCYRYNLKFKAHVNARFLSPGISYTMNLVFRYKKEWHVECFNPVRYKLDEEETKVFVVYPSTHVREDGWYIVPLYHFDNQHKRVDLNIVFEECGILLLIAGIEFLPSEEKVEVQNQVFEEYQDIVKAASQSLVYTSLDEPRQWIQNCNLLWCSLNKEGQRCEMIFIEDCLIQEDTNEGYSDRYKSHRESRFPAGLYQTNQKGFKTHVKTRLLSPSIAYTINLVFACPSDDNQEYIDLKYRLRGETTTATVYLANQRKDDSLYMAELYQFTSDGSIFDLDIDFVYHGTNIQGVEGILFQPLEKMEDQVLKDNKVEVVRTILDLDSDTYWDQKVPNDYEEILKLSKYSVKWKTKKELYSILCNGFLIANGQQWFNFNLNGKKCQMLSARAACVINDTNSTWESSNESRFGELLVITAGDKIKVASEMKPTTLSPDTTYASFLVYNLPQDQSTFEYPLKVIDEMGYIFNSTYSYLVSPPNTPVIGQKFDENSCNQLNRYKLNALPRQRSDGWMEVKVWDFQTWDICETISMNLMVEHPVKKDLCGLIIQGLEIRPI